MKNNSFTGRSALFIVLSVFVIGNTAAQISGTEEVYTLADTARARQMMDDVKILIKQSQWDDALEKAQNAKNIYIGVFGTDGAIGVYEAWYAVGYVLYKKNKFEESLQARLESLRIMKHIVGDQSPKYTNLLNQIGFCYREMEKFDMALRYFKEAEAVLIYKKMENTTEMADTYNSIGWLYFAIGSNRESIHFLQKCLEIQNANGDDISLTTAYAYMNLANCYSVQGDHYKAIQLHENGLAIIGKISGENSQSYATTLNNMGLCYQGLGEYEKAIQYHKKAIFIRESIANNSRNIIQSYLNISNVYSEMGDFQTDLSYLKKALELTLEDSTLPKQYKASALSSLGSCNINLGQYKVAKANSKEALALKKEIYGKSNPSLVLSTTNLGDTYLFESNFDSARICYFDALSILNYSPNDTQPNIEYLPLLTRTLVNLGYLETVWYLAEKEPAHLHQARFYLQQSLAMAAQISKTISPVSKSILAAESAEISSGAIATNQLLHALTDSLHYWQESFDYAERSKAYLLYESMKNADALHFAGIPDDLLEKEYKLRVEIAFHDKKRQEMLTSGVSDTDSSVLAISSKLFDLNRQHEGLIQLFEDKYPDYYQAKYGLKTASVQEIQQSLLPDQTMLQYVIGDSSIFLFLVQKDHFEVQEIKKDFPLERWVDTLTRLGIYGYHTLPLAQKTPEIETGTVNNYTQAAQRLYEKLIAPVKSKLTPELIVIPDGVLGYVPFETLLSKAPGRKGIFAFYPFLLNEHRISYCYSATLLREMRNKKHRRTPEKSVLALAPFYRGNVEMLNARVDTTELLALRDSLNTLNASGDEVAIIAKLLKGTPLYGAAASLDTFRQLAAQHRILHLSTHGKADDRVGDYAYLALGASDNTQDYEKLYARDLYNLELNADLVVLSACETGLGKLRRGEGIVSLARAFAYAGAKSLVTSLWKVDDSKTKDLLVGFYKQLKDGKSKDEALQRAKLDFLAKNRKNGGAMMHPFFWAGFIAIGDMRPIR